MILKGQGRLGFPAAKDEQTLAILEEGDFFGEATLIGEFQRIETAVAQNDCELVCLDRESFARLFEPGLSLRVVLNLVQKLRDSRSLLEGIFLEDNLSRLIFGLLHLRRKSVQQNGMEIDLSQLKDMFRLENVDQVRKYLAKLESLNVLEADGDAVRIKNSETLESILHVLSGQGKFVLKL